jgi:hypothetical protein
VLSSLSACGCDAMELQLGGLSDREIGRKSKGVKIDVVGATGLIGRPLAHHPVSVPVRLHWQNAALLERSFHPCHGAACKLV